ncbi:MAG: phospholipid carrier-dependent glycosyltransferase, partial [Armatimonadetes bacterium]|nr:phospholipid carrier-dependent glycosyltransferase [Armatimonadota bacterium]
VLSGGVLHLATYLHPEPEKMLARDDSWKIARILNTFVGSIAVAVWFNVAASLTNSLILAFLFAILLATNPALVQNSAMNMPEQWLLLLIGLTLWSWRQKRTNVLPIALAALVLALLTSVAISAGEFTPTLFLATFLATYLPLPFW